MKEPKTIQEIMDKLCPNDKLPQMLREISKGTLDGEMKETDILKKKSTNS